MRVACCLLRDGKRQFFGDECGARDTNPSHCAEAIQFETESFGLAVFKLKSAVRQLLLICFRNAQFDFGSGAFPCDNDWIENSLPAIQLALCQCVANFAGSAGAYS